MMPALAAGNCCLIDHVRMDMARKTALRAGLVLAVNLACGADPPPPTAVEPTPVAARVAPLAPVARIETADLWQDLIAQRPSALIRSDDRLVIDLGRPHARALLELAPVSPWHLAEDVDEARVGLLHGAGGSDRVRRSNTSPTCRLASGCSFHSTVIVCPGRVACRVRAIARPG